MGLPEQSGQQTPRTADYLSIAEFSVVTQSLVPWLKVLLPSLSAKLQDQNPSIEYYKQRLGVPWKQKAKVTFPGLEVMILNNRAAIKIEVPSSQSKQAEMENVVIYGFRGSEGAAPLERNDAPEPGFSFENVRPLRKYRIGGQWYEFYTRIT